MYADKKNRSSFNFGLDFPVTVFFGKHTETYPDGNVIDYNLQASTRVGFGINTIYNFRVSPAFGFNVGLRYQMPNLIGKDSKVTAASGEFNLLDKGNTSLNSNLNSDRSMASLRFFGGFAFYIGRR